MKKHLPFALVAVFAALFSCTENETPIHPLVGAWENREFVDSLDVWFVETFEIKNDSIFEQYSTVRSTEDGPDLGFRSLTQGIYTKEGDEMVLRFTSDFNYRTSLNPDALYAPKDELRQIDIFRIFNSARVQMVSNHKELEYQIICGEPFSGTPLCEEIKKFIKID